MDSLPEWESVTDKKNRTPLEDFIYYNEPSGSSTEVKDFRRGLLAAINFALQSANRRSAPCLCRVLYIHNPTHSGLLEVNPKCRLHGSES